MAMTDTKITRIDRIDSVMAGNLTWIAGHGDATRGRSDRDPCPISIGAPRAARHGTRRNACWVCYIPFASNGFWRIFCYQKNNYRLP
jgi:hypothetical protein